MFQSRLYVKASCPEERLFWFHQKGGCHSCDNTFIHSLFAISTWSGRIWKCCEIIQTSVIEHVGVNLTHFKTLNISVYPHDCSIYRSYEPGYCSTNRPGTRTTYLHHAAWHVMFPWSSSSQACHFSNRSSSNKFQMQHFLWDIKMYRGRLYNSHPYQGIQQFYH